VGDDVGRRGRARPAAPQGKGARPGQMRRGEDALDRGSCCAWGGWATPGRRRGLEGQRRGEEGHRRRGSEVARHREKPQDAREATVGCAPRLDGRRVRAPAGTTVFCTTALTPLRCANGLLQNGLQNHCWRQSESILASVKHVINLSTKPSAESVTRTK
jgi:hypothetical protein